jgi:hypothetical protein
MCSLLNLSCQFLEVIKVGNAGNYQDALLHRDLFLLQVTLSFRLYDVCVADSSFSVHHEQESLSCEAW